MAKAVAGRVKLQLVSGQATPNPPVGPSLAPYMINIPEFIKAFNGKTQDQMGLVVTTVITCFEDRSYEFEVKSPPASVLLKQAAQQPRLLGNQTGRKLLLLIANRLRKLLKLNCLT